MSVSFFPKTQCFLFWPMNKAAMVTGLEVEPGLNKMDFPLPKLILPKLLLSSTLSPQYGSIPWRDQPVNY